MSPAKRILSGVVIGLWAGLALGAETSVPEPNAAREPAATRGQWQSKVIAQPGANKPAQLARGVASNSGLNWSAVRQASAMVPAEPVAETIKPVPDPKTSAVTKKAVAPQTVAPTVPGAPAVPPAPGEMMVTPEADFVDGEIGFGGPPCDNCPGPCGPPCAKAFDVYGGDGACDRCGGGCRTLPTLSLWGGVHGFKGPTDFGRNGNFGFQEGANWSSSLGNHCPSLCGFSYQVGMNATESNFVGDQTVGRFHEGERDQAFFTAGVFHRAVCAGLQWGVVYDYLRDGYLENFELQQIRGEVSLVRQTGGEFGFWGAWGLGTDQWQGLTVEATDVYAFFYRKTFCNAGQARLWAGFTSNSDGLLGADVYIPLGESFALTSSFHYLIPEEGSEAGGSTHETWSLAMNLVWYFGRNPCVHQSPNRPLMPVADNSYFLIDTRPGLQGNDHN